MLGGCGAARWAVHVEEGYSPQRPYLGTRFQQHSDVVEHRKHDDTGLALLLLPDRLTRERGGGRLIFDVAKTINGLGRVPAPTLLPTKRSWCPHHAASAAAAIVRWSFVRRCGEVIRPQAGAWRPMFVRNTCRHTSSRRSTNAPAECFIRRPFPCSGVSPDTILDSLRRGYHPCPHYL